VARVGRRFDDEIFPLSKHRRVRQIDLRIAPESEPRPVKFTLLLFAILLLSPIASLHAQKAKPDAAAAARHADD